MILFSMNVNQTYYLIKPLLPGAFAFFFAVGVLVPEEPLSPPHSDPANARLP
jgi:hypothetical protein